jgi:hypothetical protein
MPTKESQSAMSCIVAISFSSPRFMTINTDRGLPFHRITRFLEFLDNMVRPPSTSRGRSLAGATGHASLANDGHEWRFLKDVSSGIESSEEKGDPGWHESSPSSSSSGS